MFLEEVSTENISHLKRFGLRKDRFGCLKNATKWTVFGLQKMEIICKTTMVKEMVFVHALQD